MDTTVSIVLLILSAGFILLEVFIPSMGLLTLASLGCFIGSMVLAFQIGTGFGVTLAACAVAGLPVLLWMAFKIFPKTPIGKYMILSGPGQTIKRPGARYDDLLGQEGVSRSQLRPSGVADFSGRRVDVITRGELVEPGVPIVVLEISGNRVVVKVVEKS
jgi:membrane-bound ClpP family serine protease